MFTKHQDEDQKHLSDRLWETPPGVERSIIKAKHATIESATSELTPGGAPDPDKPDDTIQANLISRVCNAKGDERRLPENAPSLLWIDFRSFGPWPDALKLGTATPLISGRTGLTSGAHGTHSGWRGAPIFEEDFSPRNRVDRWDMTAASGLPERRRANYPEPLWFYPMD